MKTQSITFKASKNSDQLRVMKLVNTMRFGVGELVAEDAVKKLINSTNQIKVIIV